MLFVNGLPLAVLELKNAAVEDATIWTAWQQLQTYKAEIPGLFASNAVLVASDGVEARVGTLSAGREWFKPWRTIEGEALAALGIYGVLSYSVTQRTAEIGIRLALGEPEARIMQRILGRTLMLACAGIGIGATASFAAARLIASMLHGVESTDALTFTTMAAVLLLVSALAGYLPARRASRTEPLIALRSA